MQQTNYYTFCLLFLKYNTTLISLDYIMLHTFPIASFFALFFAILYTNE